MIVLPPTIEARRLTVGYGAKTVLHEVSFTFAAGRISVILGAGGSGKSTLLKALGSSSTKDGEPWVKGWLEAPDFDPVAMRQKPEKVDSSLAGLLAGEDESRVDPARVLREVWRPAPAAAELLLPVLCEPLETLPYPQRRLAEFTAAVATSPYIVLDEPEMGLEPELQQWMVHRLIELRGVRTVIVATHHLGVAKAIADFALLLCDGVIIEAGESPPFFERPRHPRTQHFVRMGN